MGDTLTLPWPPSCLSPNSRKRHRHTTKERAHFKAAWWALAKQAKFSATDHLVITFHPPDAICRDLDNMLGAIKYGLDGLALATGQDDSQWAMTITKGAPHRPLGAVLIRAATVAGTVVTVEALAIEKGCAG